MSEQIDCDIAVIGGGSGGLSVAAGAALMGARTVLVERGRMGGDCLNYGCIPSKALIAAAGHATAWRHTTHLGIRYDEPEVDFAAVMRHVKNTIAGIAPHDSAERFAALGVRILQNEARFTGPDQLVAGNATIRARRIVIATGSSPAIPPIPGLDGIPYLTNETVFDLTERPLHLMILGGGPIGVELAQAFRRLGVRVTLIDRLTCLAREDAELSNLLIDALRDDGVVLHENTEVTQAESSVSGIVLTLRHSDGSVDRIAGSHLLVATGRKPNLDSLDLAKAGIAADARGITVDRRLRSTNRRVFAIGDVTGLSPFTHTAGYHAGVVLKNTLFRLPAAADHGMIPRVTYGDPELAAVGLSEAEARANHGRITILRWPFAENDRARTEGRPEGLVKAIVTPRGRILGATIVGPEAGELIQPWVMAMQKRLGIGAMQALLVPYPNRGEASKRAAGDFYRPKLLSPLTRRVVQFLARFD
ncbi:FAD-dependent oxidoreductase [Ferrovibrio sp.]|uniref:dihydrolipoyl dehydrogenase family protein n=1 Tax=Ferrovibrio sp. TaxID=1917215 RepID=UPI00260EFDB1|nr:FAD-dependent oxidoreductase [Ferrovibrio sp.]